MKKLIFFALLTLLLPLGSVSAWEAHPGEGISRAEIFLKEGNLCQALREITKVIHQDPTNAQAYKVRANIHFALEEYHKALADFDEVLALAPTTNAYLDRAIASVAVEEYEAALADVEKILAMLPAHPSAVALREKIACKVNF